jgi:hypothetical protein
MLALESDHGVTCMAEEDPIDPCGAEIVAEHEQAALYVFDGCASPSRKYGFHRTNLVPRRVTKTLTASDTSESRGPFRSSLTPIVE